MSIVCIGDSLTNGFRINRKSVWTNLLKEHLSTEVINEGINGDSTNGMLCRFGDAVIKNKPEQVIIMGSVNDLISGVSVDLIVSNILTMVHQSNYYGITPHVIVPMDIDTTMTMNYWGELTYFKNINFHLREIRKKIEVFSEMFRFNYVDLQYEFDCQSFDKLSNGLFIDGLHLTKEANAVLAKIVIGKLNSN